MICSPFILIFFSPFRGDGSGGKSPLDYIRLPGPDSEQDLIRRSNNNRWRLAKNIDYWLGVPVATQCDCWDQLYSIQSTYI